MLDDRKLEQGSKDIQMDVMSIPTIKRDELLEAMTAPLSAFYADPENQKKYEAWLAKRRAARKEVKAHETTHKDSAALCGSRKVLL